MGTYFFRVHRFPRFIFLGGAGRTKLTEAYKAHDGTDTSLVEIVKNKVRKISEVNVLPRN